MKVLLNDMLTELLEVRADFRPGMGHSIEVLGHFYIFEGVEHGKISELVKIETKDMTVYGNVVLIDWDNYITEIFVSVPFANVYRGG